jgi:hypothetical protein
MYNKKALSEAISKLNAAKAPKQKPDILYTKEGQWKHPGQITRVPLSDDKGHVTMNNVPYPVMAYPNIGEPVLMQPGEEHYFPEADYVDEDPKMRRGGSKGLPRRKTKSLSGINKLLTKNPLLRNYGHRLFDPTHNKFQEGGLASQFLERAKQAQQQNPERFAKETQKLQASKFAKDYLNKPLPDEILKERLERESYERLKQQRYTEGVELKKKLNKAAENYQEYYNKTYGSDYGELSIEDAYKKVSQPGFDVDKYAGMYNLGQPKNEQFVSNNQSTASRVWDVVTNPLTAFKYSVQTGDFRNMPSNINAARMAGQDVDPDNLVGNALNTTVNLFDAGDKVVRNVGEGNYGTAALEAMRFLPGARVNTGAGKYLTTQTPLKNAYKINPWAFKPNSNSAYRMIGDEKGLASAVESGYLQPSTTGSDINKVHNAAHYQIGVPSDTRKYFGRTWDRGYKGPYMAEVPNATTDVRFAQGPGGREMGSNVWTYPNNYIPLSEAKLYKQDWLQGYKPVEVPGQLPGSPNAVSSVDDVVDLWRIQEKGARPMSELAAEGKLGKHFQNEKAIKHFKDREEHFGQWFTKDKNDFDFYKADREFTNPEILNLKVPKSELQKYTNYNQSLSRAPDREFVVPLKDQKRFLQPSPVDDAGKGFKSEIDWAKWNKEIPENKTLMQEYKAIEKKAKADGTWMKSIDGKPWEPTPAAKALGLEEQQFIQQNSKNYKKAYPEGSFITYKGTPLPIEEMRGRPFFTGEKDVAEKFVGTHFDEKSPFYTPLRKRRFKDPEQQRFRMHEFEIPRDNNSVTFDASGQDWISFKLPDNPTTGGLNDYKNFKKALESSTHLENNNISTATLQKYLYDNDKLRYVQIKNLKEAGYPATVLGETTIVNPRIGRYTKSAIGNNGMFDMTNPNIYKALFPAAVATGVASQEYQTGGAIELKLTPEEIEWYKSQGYNVEELD